MPEVCLVCTDVEAQLCSSLNCCAHKVCMECAVKISTHNGGARCPQCRDVFETVTFFNGRFRVNVATNTFYDNSAPNPLVPYLVMSDEEMKLAGRITFETRPDENGVLIASFYVPQCLYDFRENTALIFISDADDGWGDGMVMTRAATRAGRAATFWYDKDVYSQKVQDGEALLHSMMKCPYPLMFMLAQVSKVLMSMITLGKYHLSHPPSEEAQNMHVYEDTYLLVLSTKYPPAHMGQIYFELGLA